MMKLARKGDLGLLFHIKTCSLGTPFIGQLNDFPEAERAIVWLGGQIAGVIGLMPAANVMLIASCIVAAFSFYSAARLWKVSRSHAWPHGFLPSFMHSFRIINAP